MGWWDSLKLHVLCDEAGRLCGFALVTATGDDRKLLEPLPRWMPDRSVVGDGDSLSKAMAKDLGDRAIGRLSLAFVRHFSQTMR